MQDLNIPLDFPSFFSFFSRISYVLPFLTIDQMIRTRWRPKARDTGTSSCAWQHHGGFDAGIDLA